MLGAMVDPVGGRPPGLARTCGWGAIAGPVALGPPTGSSQWFGKSRWLQGRATPNLLTERYLNEPRQGKITQQ
jgi:hypothetical protein